MNMDRLCENVASKGIVCLGLDTGTAYMPPDFLAKFDTPAQAVLAYNRAIIDATHDVVACYKLQIAYYEALGLEGLKAFAETLAYIKSVGQLRITDCKRGDIAATAKMYAQAHFTGDFETDFVTLNAYMGLDSLTPYEPYFEQGKGCFVLVRTSNPGAHDLQYLHDKATNQPIYEILGEKLEELGQKYMGSHGYSAIGTVMGATNTEEIATLREKFRNTFLLVPGFGAQGGTAHDASLFLRDGNGGVVNSSRGILMAWKKREEGPANFAAAARAEAIAMNADILGK